MRILHIIYDDISNPWLGGGGATRTLEIYSRIAAEGHKVLVVCGKYPGSPNKENRRGVSYRRVGLSQSYISSRLGLTRDPKSKIQNPKSSQSYVSSRLGFMFG